MESRKERAVSRVTDKDVADLTCPAGRKDKLFSIGGVRGLGIRVTMAWTTELPS